MKENFESDFPSWIRNVQVNEKEWILLSNENQYDVSFYKSNSPESLVVF